MAALPTGVNSFHVSINGISTEGLLRASIVSTNCFSADTFSLSFSMGSHPLSDMAFWSAVVSAYVEVSVATTAGPTFVSLMTGMIDTIQLDPIQNTVMVEGRDLSALMIDCYRQQVFVNQTAAEVVSAIGQYHGLASIVTATSDNVGRYYGDGYTKLSLGQFSRVRSDWDLVVQLARENNFDTFVENRTLYFQPANGDGEPSVVLSTRDVQRLRIERNLNVPETSTANVQSWNSQNMASYRSGNLESANNGEQASTASSDGAFLFSASNLTSEQVEDAAGRYATELGRLAVVLHIDMPWDLTISPRTLVLLSGTGSGFDVVYKIDSVERHYSSTSGSSQSVRAIQA